MKNVSMFIAVVGLALGMTGCNKCCSTPESAAPEAAVTAPATPEAPVAPEAAK